MKLKVIAILIVIVFMFLLVILNTENRNDTRQKLGEDFLLDYYSVSDDEVKQFENYLFSFPKTIDSELTPDTGIVIATVSEYEIEINEKYSRYLDAKEINRLMMNRLLNDPVNYAFSNNCTLDVSNVEITVYEEHNDYTIYKYSVSINSTSETGDNLDNITQSGILKIENVNETPLIVLTDITHLK